MPSRQSSASSSSGTSSSPMIASSISAAQLVLVPDVVVEGHRAGAEHARDPAHGHCLEALLVGDQAARSRRSAHASRTPGRSPPPRPRRRCLRLACARRPLTFVHRTTKAVRMLYEQERTLYEQRWIEAYGLGKRYDELWALREARPRRSRPARCSGSSGTTAPARRPPSASSPRSPLPTTGPRPRGRPRRRRRRRRRACPDRPRRPRPRPSTACSPARKNLELVGRLYHLPKAAARARAVELLERLDLARRRRPPGQDPSPAACAAGSTSRPRSSPPRR